MYQNYQITRDVLQNIIHFLKNLGKYPGRSSFLVKLHLEGRQINMKDV